MKPDLNGVHMKSKWLIKVAATGVLSWSLLLRWDVRRCKSHLSGKGTMRLVLHACWAFLINSNDGQTQCLPDMSSQTPTTKKTATHSLLSLFLCCCTALVSFTCSLNHHYISFHSPQVCHLPLTPLKAENSAQDRSSSARLLEHNSFYVFAL